jgi:ubiquinone/menaquinone biosynthesis C-methylase UbiE
MKDADKQVDRIVKDWYANKASHEWRRLQQDPYHQIEFMLTIHFLEKYLPRSGTVLDAGGGPDRYSIELAKQGYSIVLLDLVPEMLRTARKKMKQAGVLGKVKQFVQGSVEDLSIFPDETFDSVLCLGPLSHLLGARQREKAAEELVRVAKKKAPIFVSVISRIGLLKTILLNFPHEMRYARQASRYVKRVDFVLTSPPYLDQNRYSDIEKRVKQLAESKTTDVGKQAAEGKYRIHYSPSKRNIGNLNEKKYFRAMFKVYKECFEVLKKGGLAAVVVRPLARNKSVFDLPYQTWLILQKVGFRLVDLYTIEIPRSLWANIYEEHYPLVAKIRRDYIIVVRKPRSLRNVPSRIMSKSAF